jgi:PKD repeat protein
LNVTGLPPGLTFTDNGDGTGEITGTPTETGYYTLTFTASNSIGSTQKSLKVLVAQPVVFTSADETTFEAGEFNSFEITATGFPTADIDLIGSLPPGVKLRDDGDNVAILSGTPKKGGVYHFTLAFGTGGDEKRVYQAFTLTVDGLV